MPADKPAATVHGTRSGLCGVCARHQSDPIHANNGEWGATHYFEPAPPASPTVTLDRETLETLLEIVPQFPPSTRYGKAFEDAITRLRAAERQK